MKGKISGKLWEFIRDLLLSERTNPSFIRWERREDGVFKFVQSDKVAKMWGERKQNPKMTYEKLSRAMRYYYKSKVLLPVFGRRLVYKFGPNATGWMSTVQPAGPTPLAPSSTHLEHQNNGNHNQNNQPTPQQQQHPDHSHQQAAMAGLMEAQQMATFGNNNGQQESRTLSLMDQFDERCLQQTVMSLAMEGGPPTGGDHYDIVDAFSMA